MGPSVELSLTHFESHPVVTACEQEELSDNTGSPTLRESKTPNPQPVRKRRGDEGRRRGL